MSITLSQMLVKLGYDGSAASAGLAKTQGEMNATGAAAGKMGAQQEQATRSVSNAISKMSIAATAGFVGIGIASIKMATDFQHGIAQVGAIAGATDAQMKGLSDTALRIGKDTAFSAKQATSAMEELAAGGVSTADIMNGAADATVALAAAGGTDLATAANVAAAALNVWGLSVSDLKVVVNDVAGAANVSKFGVEDMSLAIAQGGGVAAAAGVDFNDFSATIAATSSSFSSGSDAGTSFKTFLISLANPSKQAAAAMAEIGFNAYDAQGNLKSMADITQDLHDKLGPLTEQQRAQTAATIFGTDAMRTGLALTKMTGDEFQTLSDKMKNTDAAAVAAQRMKGLSGDIEQLKGSLETASITLGTTFLPMLSAGAQKATEAVNAFGAVPASTRSMALGFGTLAAAMPIMVSGVAKVAGGLAVARKAFDNAGSAADTMGQAMIRAKLSMAGFAVGIGAIALVGDAILQKTSGHGLIEWIFGDPTKADATTAALHAAQVAYGAIEDPVRKVAAAQDDLVKSSGELDHALNNTGDSLTSIRGWLAPLPGVENETELAVSKATGAFKGQTDALFELNPTMAQVQAIYQQMPADVQAVFASTQGYKDLVIATAAANSEQAGAMDKMAASTIAETKAFVDSTGAVAAGMTASLTSVAGFATYMSGEWGPQLGGVLTAFAASSKESFDGFTGKIPETIQSAAEMSAYLKDNWSKEAAAAFDDWHKAVVSNFDDVKSAIQSVLPTVDESFAEWKKRLDQMATDQGNFEANLTAIYKGITTAGVAMPNEIIAAIADKGPAFAAKFAKLYATDPEAAINALKVAAPLAMGETADSITNRVIGGKPGMDAATTALVTKPMTDAMIAANTEAVNGLSKVNKSLNDGTYEMVPSVTTAGTAVGTGLVGGVTSGITDGSSDAVAEANKLGNDIALGISAGIRYMIAANEAAASDLVTAALEAGRWTSMTHSPSKLFEEQLGKPIGQGVAVGITKEAGTVADALSASVTSAVGAAKDAFVPLIDGAAATAATWVTALKNGLDFGTAMYTDDIAQMFGDLNYLTEHSGLSDSARKAMESQRAALMNGFQQTGSLSNTAMIDMFDKLIKPTAASGVTSVTDSMIDAWSNGAESLASRTGNDLEAWRSVLVDGLQMGQSLSLGQISVMFRVLNDSVANSGMPDSAKRAMEATRAALMNGFKETGSLSNTALIDMFTDLEKTIGTAAPKAASGVTSVTDSMIDAWHQGISAFDNRTTDKLQDWVNKLHDGLELGASMSDDEIASMFGAMSEAISNSGLDAATENAMEAMRAKLMEGFRETGSLSNAALISMFNDLMRVARAAGTALAATVGAAVGGASVAGGGGPDTSNVLAYGAGGVSTSAGMGPGKAVVGKDGNIPGIQGYDVVWTPGAGWQYVAHDYGGSAPGKPIAGPNGSYLPGDSAANHPGQYWDGSAWRSTNVNNAKSNPTYEQAVTTAAAPGSSGHFNPDGSWSGYGSTFADAGAMNGVAPKAQWNGIGQVPLGPWTGTGNAVSDAGSGGWGANATPDQRMNGNPQTITVNLHLDGEVIATKVVTPAITKWADNQLGYGATQAGVA